MIPHYLQLFTVIWITVYFIPLVNMIFKMKLVNAHFRMRHSFSCWSQVTSHLIASILFQMACVIVYNRICFKKWQTRKMNHNDTPRTFKILNLKKQINNACRQQITWWYYCYLKPTKDTQQTNKLNDLNLNFRKQLIFLALLTHKWMLTFKKCFRQVLL